MSTHFTIVFEQVLDDDTNVRDELATFSLGNARFLGDTLATDGEYGEMVLSVESTISWLQRCHNAFQKRFVDHRMSVPEQSMYRSVATFIHQMRSDNAVCRVQWG